MVPCFRFCRHESTQSFRIYQFCWTHGLRRPPSGLRAGVAWRNGRWRPSRDLKLRVEAVYLDCKPWSIAAASQDVRISFPTSLPRSDIDFIHRMEILSSISYGDSKVACQEKNTERVISEMRWRADATLWRSQPEGCVCVVIFLAWHLAV